MLVALCVAVLWVHAPADDWTKARDKDAGVALKAFKEVTAGSTGQQKAVADLSSGACDLLAAYPGVGEVAPVFLTFFLTFFGQQPKPHTDLVQQMLGRVMTGQHHIGVTLGALQRELDQTWNTVNEMEVDEVRNMHMMNEIAGTYKEYMDECRTVAQDPSDPSLLRDMQECRDRASKRFRELVRNPNGYKPANVEAILRSALRSTVGGVPGGPGEDRQELSHMMIAGAASDDDTPNANAVRYANKFHDQIQAYDELATNLNLPVHLPLATLADNKGRCRAASQFLATNTQQMSAHRRVRLRDALAARRRPVGLMEALL